MYKLQILKMRHLFSITSAQIMKNSYGYIVSGGRINLWLKWKENPENPTLV